MSAPYLTSFTLAFWQDGLSRLLVYDGVIAPNPLYHAVPDYEVIEESWENNGIDYFYRSEEFVYPRDGLLLDTLEDPTALSLELTTVRQYSILVNCDNPKDCKHSFDCTRLCFSSFISDLTSRHAEIDDIELSRGSDV
jgi:hypothetical protein